MIWRILFVFVVVGVAWLVVSLWERRAVPSPTFGAGLTVVTGPGCSLCPMAVAATDGAGIPVSVVDVSDVGESGIRSVPTAIVVDRDGVLVARRSGRSAISGMPELIALARGVA